MLEPAAILGFVDAQKRLLRKIYDEAWQKGVDGYQPDANPSTPPDQPKEWAIVGLTGAALLLALRNYPYEPPTSPDQLRRALALAPAFNGLNTMAAELGSLLGGAAQQVLQTDNSIADALSQWANDNAWRLDAGTSVAWAGEQAGYAESANADGQLLWGWQSVGDTHVCSDCELLSSFPPMPLSEWPTAPGAGDTQCNVGCRCTWETYGSASISASYIPSLSTTQQDLVSSLADRQSQALVDLMPDAAYL